MKFIFEKDSIKEVALSKTFDDLFDRGYKIEVEYKQDCPLIECEECVK